MLEEHLLYNCVVSETSEQNAMAFSGVAVNMEETSCRVSCSHGCA